MAVDSIINARKIGAWLFCSDVSRGNVCRTRVLRCQIVTLYRRFDQFAATLSVPTVILQVWFLDFFVLFLCVMWILLLWLLLVFCYCCLSVY